GRVEHRHAALGELRHRNVVGARAGPADGLDARRNIHLMHVSRAHQHRIRMTDLGSDFVAVPRQAVQSAHGNVVEREDLERHGVAGDWRLSAGDWCLGHIWRRAPRSGGPWASRPRRWPLGASQPYFLSNSFMNATSASTPSIGMAL